MAPLAQSYLLLIVPFMLIFFTLEALLCKFFGARIRRKINGATDAALEATVVEYASRLMESCLGLIMSLAALEACAVYFLEGLDPVFAYPESSHYLFSFACAFFLYHLQRVLVIPGYARGLIYHHLGMVGVISVGVMAEQLLLYVCMALIPYLSAIFRNYNWQLKKQGRSRSLWGARFTFFSPVLTESVPTLCIVGHFIFVASGIVSLPWAAWVFGVLPALLLCLSAFYWSYIYYKVAVKSLKRIKMAKANRQLSTQLSIQLSNQVSTQ